MTPPILTVTMNPSLDVTAQVKRLVPREKLRCEDPIAEPGGGGINVSRVIRKLGGETTLFSGLGGATGEQIVTLLKEADIPVDPFRVEGATRQTMMIYDQAAETQYRFLMPGPAWRDGEWEKALDRIDTLAKDHRYVVASGSLPPGVPEDFFARLGHRLHEEGCEFVLDTSNAALRSALDAPIAILKIDEEELRDLIDGSTDTPAEELAATKALLTRTGAKCVVVTLGGRGALVATPDHCERLPAADVKPVSTVGAGDSFVAAMTKALCEGWELRQAVIYGSAAGGAAVITPGSELVRAGDVERLYTHMKDLPPTEC